MLGALYSGDFDYWLMYHKAVFDPLYKLIYISSEATEIDVYVDLYSDSKEWHSLRDNGRYEPPMRSVGGDILPGGAPLGRTFFLTNGWRVVVDHSVNFTGNLYSDDFASPFIKVTGAHLASAKVSNLVDVAETTVGVPTAIEVADIVWAHIKAEALKSSVDAVSVQVSDVSTDIGLLSGLMTTVSGNVTAVSAQVSGVSTQVSDVSTAMSSLSVDLSQVRSGLDIVRALVNENSVTDQHGYDSSGNLLTARVRSYDTKANALSATGTGLLQTLTMVATYDGNNRLLSYRLLREGS